MKPKQFLWGASLSAHQTEGAVNEDGKIPSVQDTRIRNNPNIADFSVAVDHYHRYKTDIKMLKDANITALRISIAWTRIINRDGSINQLGLTHYDHVIDELINAGITPIVTTYHFDLPDYLQQSGGWKNRDTVTAYYAYVKVLFEHFGDRVKQWLTINEPNIMLLADQKIVGFHDDAVDRYQSFYNLMIAEKFAIKACHQLVSNAEIGPVPNISYVYPRSSKPEDIRAAMEFNSIRNWAYLDFSIKGRINPIFKAHLHSLGIEMFIQPEDRELVANNVPDFIGLNYYTSATVCFPDENEARSAGVSDQQSEDVYEPKHYKGITNPYLRKNQFNWTIDPLGLQTTLEITNDRYETPILITENGLGAYDELTDSYEIHDQYRIDYLEQHLTAIDSASENGVQVVGYLPWSAIDLISVHEGIKKRYGFIYVDRSDSQLKDLKRYPKDSYYWFKRIIGERS
ncbi:6-phospho-beta-glucosidase [Lactiplantibacillus fabifermentans T30PCM01]|uniref:6-phospho-beta-glucosidase n=1 Tax=Lactiplantibacillus fabifermentans T30PCM01 TaxID=1400520 RepID=W6T514_9LACO|nr:glycoside hydrolase family 1 protein [Lactiplantibacillus fabifermentans]ETY72878.1 6-phospho-beta-glucosidase [Lactiplantibacillus fabifermentans T30PCM01]